MKRIDEWAFFRKPSGQKAFHKKCETSATNAGMMSANPMASSFSKKPWRRSRNTTTHKSEVSAYQIILPKNKFRFSLDISSIVPYCESEVLRI